MNKFPLKIISISSLLISTLLAPDAHGQLWLEFWQKEDYRSTNFSDRKPFEVNDYLLSSSALRLGFRYYLHNEDSSSLRIGLDLYGRGELIHDFSNAKFKHDNVYNNNVKFGGGIKFRVEQEWDQDSEFRTSLLRYLQFDILAEWQNMNTFVSAVEYWFDDIEDSNLRLGLNGWTNSDAIIGSEKLSLRQETYLDFSYQSTNFGEKNAGKYLILTASPRLFIRFHNQFDIYGNLELVKDFLTDGDWNRNPFSNNIKFFSGIRFITPLARAKEKKSAFSNASLLLFAERGNIHYLDNKEDWSFGSPELELAEHDFRFGIVLWIPFGESTYRPIGQSPL